jgi:proteasome lid subunit RPN8/RPN11
LASDAASIIVPVLLWMRLLRELRRRGGGRRETGAFLLRDRRAGGGRITRFICYDDLDPESCRSGAIAFHANGYAALWEYCRKRTVEVIADVHTHPGPHVGQSGIDQRHPMVPVLGHTAMIVPSFANAPWWSLEKVGVYEYLGDFKWRVHGPSKGQRRVRLTLW